VYRVRPWPLREQAEAALSAERRRGSAGGHTGTAPPGVAGPSAKSKP
jgi:hypothetical protein